MLPPEAVGSPPGSGYSRAMIHQAQIPVSPAALTSGQSLRLFASRLRLLP